MTRVALLLVIAAGCLPQPADEQVESVVFGGGLCPYGACWSELSFDGSDLALAGYESDGTPWSQAGSLTAAGQDALAAALSDVSGEPLDETYGCPGCDDGAAITVTLVDDAGGERATTYEGDHPPEPLVALDALATELYGALLTCVPTANVEVGGGCTAH